MKSLSSRGNEEIYFEYKYGPRAKWIDILTKGKGEEWKIGMKSTHVGMNMTETTHMPMSE